MKQLMRKQSYKRIALVLGTGLALTVGLFELGWVVMHRPPKARVVVQVNPPEEEEITTFGTVRTVYSQDGKTVIEKHTPYRDGATGHQYFRADGTLKQTKEDYPLRQGKPTQMKAKADWSEDGKTLTSGEVYRPNGSLWFTVKRMPNNDRVETFFFPDGWRFSTLVSKSGSGEQEMTFFRKDGSTWAKEVQTRNQWFSVSTQRLEFYDATGKELLWSSHPMTMNEKLDGFVAPSYGKLVRFYSGGTLTHQQWWDNSWNSLLSQSGSLKFVEVFESDGFTNDLAKTIVVEDAGALVKLKEVQFANGGKRVFRNFGGNLKQIPLEKVLVNGQPKERKIELGTLSAEIDKQGTRVEHDTAEQIYETLDAAQLARPDEQELTDKRSQSQAENKSVLGPRDDRDPCKWYHRQ